MWTLTLSYREKETRYNVRQSEIDDLRKTNNVRLGSSKVPSQKWLLTRILIEKFWRDIFQEEEVVFVEIWSHRSP